MHLAVLERDDQHHDESLQLLDRALAIYAAGAADHQALRAMLTRADVLARLQRKTESMQALAGARAFLPKVSTPANIAYFHSRAAEVSARLGDHQAAYREMQLLREADRRLREAENSKLDDELRMRFEVQLKDAENQLLRSQRHEAESRRLALSLALALSVVVLGGIAFFLRRRAVLARREAAHHKALAEAQAMASRAKTTFLATMSHELRSPLNAMLGFTRLLARDERLHAGAREDLRTVLESGEHLYALINQVLDLSKIEAGRMELAQSDFDLPVLLDELRAMFAVAARQKNLTLSIDRAPDVPRGVRADVVKLRQVLINLLGNALKFTREGAVSLEVAVACADPCRLRFAVSDTGPGIAPEDLTRLGEAFVQAQAGQRALEGSGLGLAISRGFVELMGGALTIASRLGQGTTLAFTLPVQRAEAPSAAVPSRRVKGLACGQPRWRILVADDQPDGRQLLVRVLAPLGFEVKPARARRRGGAAVAELAAAVDLHGHAHAGPGRPASRPHHPGAGGAGACRKDGDPGPDRQQLRGGSRRDHGGGLRRLPAQALPRRGAARNDPRTPAARL
jgi:signal transduction histidine kinase